MQNLGSPWTCGGASAFFNEVGLQPNGVVAVEVAVVKDAGVAVSGLDVVAVGPSGVLLRQSLAGPACELTGTSASPAGGPPFTVDFYVCTSTNPQAAPVRRAKTAFACSPAATPLTLAPPTHSHTHASLTLLFLSLFFICFLLCSPRQWA